MSSIETVIAVVVIMAYSIGRQLRGEPLRVRRLIGLPVALTVIGIVDIASSRGAAPTTADIVLIGAGCAVNAGIGMCQGGMMRLESQDGYLWGQMPTSVLWWWAAKISSGVVLDGIAYALGAHLVTISAVMLFELGVNRLAQAATVATRGLLVGVPFAPETDSPTPALGRSVAGQPSTNQSADDPSRSRSRLPGTFGGSVTQPISPPTTLVRQLSLLLREMNGRRNDALK